MTGHEWRLPTNLLKEYLKSFWNFIRMIILTSLKIKHCAIGGYLSNNSKWLHILFFYLGWFSPQLSLLPSFTMTSSTGTTLWHTSEECILRRWIYWRSNSWSSSTGVSGLTQANTSFISKDFFSTSPSLNSRHSRNRACKRWFLNRLSALHNSKLFTLPINKW